MEKLIADEDLLPPGSSVLCAVSGGADSICLLHALYQLRPKRGFSLAAAHYNHQLRGMESDWDAAFVAQWVSLYCGPQRMADGSLLPAVPLLSGSGDVDGESKRRGTGVEETAREMRYAFLRAAAQEAGCDLIATAHNADDNVETILFHLARGTGLRGLTGIQPKRDGLIRPLLTTTRQEIDAYLLAYGLRHVEDRTNQDDTYSRNRIRHQVTPVLESICPGFTARAADMAALLRADEDYLSQQAKVISDQAQIQEDSLSLPAALIGQAADPVAVRAVRQLIGTLNGGDQDCSAAHLTAVVQLCRGESPSAQTNLPGGLIARRVYDNLLLTYESAPDSPQPIPMPLPGQVQFGTWQVSCAQETYTGQPQSPCDFWLSASAVPSVTLRLRQTGDSLKLPGRHKKTIKKWLIDEKIPRWDRDALPVLDHGGTPAALVGLGPDAHFLPQPGQEAWHFTASR
jgi:tRNA(Ile)-lysidine synthetase-like protein